MQNTPCEPTLNTILINSCLFALDNRFPIETGAIIFTFKIINRMNRNESENSKQTGNSGGKKQIPGDWLPDSAVSKLNLAKPTNDEVEAEFQKMLEEGIIDGINPNRSATKANENSICTDDTIQPEERNDTADSVQTEVAEIAESTTPTESKKSTVSNVTPKRTSSKQRKESLDEYRKTFLHVPKLDDRKPVFISREVRDQLDEIARKLGGRGMSVSGFIENLARHHLEIYHDDVEIWKKL